MNFTIHLKIIDNFNTNESSIFFSVDFWSVSNRILNDVKNTNNVIEEWNRSLNNNITSKNPNLFEIGSEIRKKHASVENKISKFFIEINFNEEYNYEDSKLLWFKKNSNYKKFYGIDFLKMIASDLKLKEPYKIKYLKFKFLNFFELHFYV
ncbi:hypothetical protein DMUE_1513 [Dictyocoela muelleri]|nr:hypothetical protein DMUE_1513 [Dictyocoela muelleri]